MKTYYLDIFKNKNLILHYATIRSDWTNADWKHLAETFTTGYFHSDVGGKLKLADIAKSGCMKSNFLAWYNK